MVKSTINRKKIKIREILYPENLVIHKTNDFEQFYGTIHLTVNDLRLAVRREL